MKKNRLFIIITLILCIMLSACGTYQKSNTTDGKPNSVPRDENYVEYPGESGYGYEEGRTESSKEPLAKDGTDALINSNRKLIIKGELEVETKEFENSNKLLLESIKKYNGYVQELSESFDIAWNNTNEKIRVGRYTYVVRVPYDKTNEFINSIGDVGSIIYKNLFSEDVSLKYSETERRIKLYDAKIERLEKLLAQATKMEDILLIQKEIESAIESKEILAGDFKELQDLVNLSTITIYLREVKSYTKSVVAKDSFGDRIVSAIGASFRNFINFLEDFVISLIYILPVLIFLALILFIIIKIVKKLKRKSQFKLFNKNSKFRFKNKETDKTNDDKKD